MVAFNGVKRSHKNVMLGFGHRPQKNYKSMALAAMSIVIVVFKIMESVFL